MVFCQVSVFLVFKKVKPQKYSNSEESSTPSPLNELGSPKIAVIRRKDSKLFVYFLCLLFFLFISLNTNIIN